jgi:sugar lactone lactonase YvrE
MTGDERETGNERQPVLIALLVAALLLGAFGLRSANLLAFSRAHLGTELLAQQTATLGTLPRIEGFLHLARDVGVNDGSARDPTGSHGLSIALERDVQWPYVWYFREFPDLTVMEPGTAATTGAQVAIAASDAGLVEAGYATESWPWLTTVPPQYLDPDMGAVMRALVNPTRWLDVWRYLLFRDGVPLPPESTVAVGLAPELAGRVAPVTGPFSLADRAGPGTEPGQFKDPIGVAVGSDGVIAVVDSGNARVQRFDRDGKLLGVWGEDENGVTFTRTANGLGPTGITLAPDGITWVADTWGHRVVALDANGAIVQTIGAETVDTGDDPSRVDEAGGRFFGPRDMEVSDDAVYVVDTGNERVQVFSRDGTFVNAWGGYGSGPDQLIEPVGIALGPNGNVYVADSGNARISIFTPDGEPVAQWPVSAWPAPAPGGLPPAFQPYLAFDADGNLYATASNAGQVLVFDSEGELISAVTDADGERLTQPVGVAISSDGIVRITDVGRDAVLEYTPSRSVSLEDLDQEDVGASPRP